MSKDSDIEADIKRIKASLDLQKRVGTGTVDEKKIERAQDVIKNNKVDFAPIARPHLMNSAKRSARHAA